MAKTQTVQNETEYEPEPIEGPSTELARIMQEGDPDTMLAILERKAVLARRVTDAINAILVACTFPEDWIQHGDMMCLKSAAAERVARNFDIRFANCMHKKEEIQDSLGKGYRYSFEGEASMGNRVVYTQGVYSTRDKFLSYKDGEYKALEDINENNIRNAAYHIMIGNGIKALLGLRGIPKARFDEIMAKQGESGNKATSVAYGKGTQGGTTAEDSVMQKELAELLIEIANAGYMIRVENDGSHTFEEISEIADPLEVAKASCKALSSFWSKKDNKVISGLDSAKALKGKRLEIALANGKKLWTEFQKEGQGEQ